MKIVVIGLSAVLALAGCAGQQIETPAQPTPVSINATITSLAAITADPVTSWQAGDYAVRAACHAYLNQAAARSANFGTASAAIGTAGAGAAGFLISSNPYGAAAAAAVATLAQTFLGEYQQSGGIPYTPQTSAAIEDALDAYETAVAASPPTSTAQAASYTDDEWYLCTPAGYAEIATKAIGSATISASAGGMSSPSAAFESRSVPVNYGRPKVYVNGH